LLHLASHILAVSRFAVCGSVLCSPTDRALSAGCRLLLDKYRAH
jgi:hypothetical protein